MALHDVLLAPLRVVGKLLGVGYGLIVFLWGFASISLVFMLATIIVLYGFGFAAGPMLGSSPVLEPKITAGSQLLTAVGTALGNFATSIVNCTRNNLVDILNPITRLLFGLGRFALWFASLFGAPLPGWFEWADRGVSLHAVVEAARVARTLSQVRLASRDPDPMRRLAGVSVRAETVRRDLLQDICSGGESIVSILVFILDLFKTFLFDFLNFMRTYYDPALGFNKSFIDIFIRYIVYKLLELVPALSCLFDPADFDLDNPAAFIPDPHSILACVFYRGNRNETPEFLPMAAVGIFCDVSDYIDSSSIEDVGRVLLECVGLGGAISSLKDAVTKILKAITDSDTYITKAQGFLTRIETLLNEGNGVISELNTLLGRDMADREQLSNATRSMIDRTLVVEPSVCDVLTNPVFRARSTGEAPPTAEPTGGGWSQRRFASRPRNRTRTYEDIRREAGERARAMERAFADGFNAMRNNGTFAMMPMRVREKHGDVAGDYAELVLAGVLGSADALVDAWYNGKTVHDVSRAFMREDIIHGFHAAQLLKRHLEQPDSGYTRSPGSFAMETQARMAVQLTLSKDGYAHLFAELHASGHGHIADAFETTVRGATIGVVDPARARAETVRAHAQMERDRAEIARLQQEAREAVAHTTAMFHVGAMGGGVLFSSFFQLAWIGGAGMLQTLAQAAGVLVASLLIVFGAAATVVSAFFQNLAQSGPLRNDIVTPIFGLAGPLISHAWSAGFTDAALDSFIHNMIDLAEREAEWFAVEIVRMPFCLLGACPPGMPLDSDGSPRGDILAWLVDYVLNAPIDQPCNVDFAGFSCRLESDTAYEMTLDMTNALCVDVGIACTFDSDCPDGHPCVDLAGSPGYPAYGPCPPSGCAAGMCKYACSTAQDCPDPLPSTCTNMINSTIACNETNPCGNGVIVSWPILPRVRYQFPNLTIDAHADCALVGIDPANAVYWERPTFALYFDGQIPLWRLVLSLDMLYYHLRCVQYLYYSARLFAAWVLNSWRVPAQIGAMPLFSSFLIVVPTGILNRAGDTGILGDVTKTLIGGSAGVRSAADWLEGTIWPLTWVGGELRFVADYRPVGGVESCIGRAAPQSAIAIADILVLELLISMGLLSGLIAALLLLVWAIVLLPVRILCGVLSVFWTGSVLARGNAVSADDVYEPGGGDSDGDGGEELTVMGDIPDRKPPPRLGATPRRSALPPGHRLRCRMAHTVHIGPYEVTPSTVAARPAPWRPSLSVGAQLAWRALPSIAMSGGLGRHPIHYLFDRNGHPITARLHMTRA